MKKNLKQKIHDYTAILEPIRGGGFTVSFPDFPGCVTFGTSFEHAQKMARDALGLWLEELVASKEEIPTGSGSVITSIRVPLPVSK